MSAKSKQAMKERRKERIERREHLTNWYMLNLTYGALGIIVLMIIRSCYRRSSVLVHMQTVTWILTALFAVGAVALFALGKAGKIKNNKRAVNYSILLGICALFALWLALYNKIRMVMESAARTLLNNPNLTVSSYWNTRIPIIAIAVYLVAAFVVYLIKANKK